MVISEGCKKQVQSSVKVKLLFLIYDEQSRYNEIKIRELEILGE